MNKLKDYLMRMTVPERSAFAQSCGTTLKHMMNVAYGQRSCGEGLALLIQKNTSGELTVKDLRPTFANQLADAGYVLNGEAA